MNENSPEMLGKKGGWGVRPGSEMHEHTAVEDCNAAFQIQR
jgi:hypothetical protein